MQLVLLQDMVSSYAANWGRVANTEGIERIQIGDCFKEQGTYEELRVAGIDISPVGGASRLYFERCANATQPQTHRIGAVLEPVGVKEMDQLDAILADVKEHWPDAVMVPVVDGKLVTSEEKQELVGAALANISAATSVTNQPLNGLSELEDFPAPQHFAAIKPSKAAANALRQKRFREHKKLENSQHD